MKRLAVLGSTGSIGTQTLDIVRKYRDRLEVSLLAASRVSEKLLDQIDEFKPEYVYIAEGEKIKGVKTLIGEDGLYKLAQLDIDLFINGISGINGILPTYLLLENNKKLATANKEAIICLGEIYGDKYSDIFPIDSEHSAIFQCLLSGRKEEVEKIILTASGGPFLNLPKEEFRYITPDQALNHPRWKMGKKVSIDSATLMNKGFEIIEAHYLFNIPYSKIDVVIHPESIVHGLVQFIDGSVISHLSPPDMRIPICYAISYPERWEIDVRRLNLAQVKNLTFLEPDYDRFPLLNIAKECGEKGGACPTVLTTADEIAVNLFLEGKITFDMIPVYIQQVLDQADFSKPETFEDIIFIIKETEKIFWNILKLQNVN
ncbi:MAG TPA: 1-deoxy-D-xylulose-5-phosphate reductoisomerase [Persephonella sp.]|uniref:1-deoxy-D-xylulose 5-phosphate reductoisomerase n=1 Tax=Persephonella marina (strain DSM 14350 / EX-H1) TaxID=123214 RepID=DXR_PERMH|nr:MULTISPECIES: 1-deoxy-D-xylulose-5-phosphate reductoisomerase [Persephonella]C0QTC4.1 RecName: Full=1-deoxy-D-xylulose 5-phosphate reductoisomerase; Short=DXP reductoisomerase; AltName: Full=1-deoxyxylulose-5-phosphate reductoisomerase; AltName: Full=2-C-methyl-D-erythritol 4-phosphate synthase [Persephonella marina EX-H1]ACO04698.1 1-deoxy-D-xylulose 5-phosphate reductoisomerase [Persephonella marina EX-H1]HCB70442.1 1-deoxy-D-xylulose-5-phosphate reductoisomerase [Persephonella sp.]